MGGAEVKRLILENGVRLWQVASKWGLTDGNFSRRLRKPFDEKEIERIKKIITDLKMEQQVLTMNEQDKNTSR